MISTTADKNRKKTRIRLWSVAFWLLLWEIVSRIIGQEILLVSPVSVIRRLFELGTEADFWSSVAYSFGRIIGGFLLAACCGVLLAGAGAACRFVRELAAPAMAAVKATPVASFIILVLIWVPSRNLSVVISFLMVLPVIYTNVLNGIQSTDRKLLEMAEVFDVSPWRRIKYIYMSSVLPYFRAGCSLGLGLCWKAGVAAEVIGIPAGSIGEKLYEAKVYLETPDLFSWTIVIIILSIAFEKVFLLLTDLLVGRVERR
ncbi:ABC transporter permease [Murimonas intestini]|uniref:ABC transporter permease n=1 Tax=Murimonas intestini TaxID=1337051 RepID=UPI0011DC94A1|nr:ABC transporter permease subunit [Murimonas intestini]